jgi:hypothetical protein
MKKHLVVLLLMSFMSSSSFGSNEFFRKSKNRKTKKNEIVCKDPKKGDCCKKSYTRVLDKSDNVVVKN